MHKYCSSQITYWLFLFSLCWQLVVVVNVDAMTRVRERFLLLHWSDSSYFCYFCKCQWQTDKYSKLKMTNFLIYAFVLDFFPIRITFDTVNVVVFHEQKKGYEKQLCFGMIDMVDIILFTILFLTNNLIICGNLGCPILF